MDTTGVAINYVAQFSDSLLLRAFRYSIFLAGPSSVFFSRPGWFVNTTRAHRGFCGRVRCATCLICHVPISASVGELGDVGSRVTTRCPCELRAAGALTPATAELVLSNDEQGGEGRNGNYFFCARRILVKPRMRPSRGIRRAPRRKPTGQYCAWKERTGRCDSSRFAVCFLCVCLSSRRLLNNPAVASTWPSRLRPQPPPTRCVPLPLLLGVKTLPSYHAPANSIHPPLKRDGAAYGVGGGKAQMHGPVGCRWRR